MIGLVDAEKLKPGDLVVSGVPEPRQNFSNEISPTEPLPQAQVTVGPESLQSSLESQILSICSLNLVLPSPISFFSLYKHLSPRLLIRP